MAETEVESILREIRERVLSEQRAGRDLTGTAARAAMASGGNGARDSDAREMRDAGTSAAEGLALLNSYLTTTARAWDRLPPMVSNRSGLLSRVELWLKRNLKRATHWFTWEQVNFNAAVHHAIREQLQLLSAHEQELQRLRAELEARSAETTAQQAELRVELVNELRERDERLQGEQRVCFKQLALETTEAAVLEDRARRKSETLLTELQRRVEQLEQK